MSAEKQRKDSRQSDVREDSSSKPPRSFRAVTYARMQILDLEFLTIRKLMSDPKTFDEVKTCLADAKACITGIKMMSLTGCNGDPCEPDEHCMSGRCVFGPARDDEMA